MEPFLEKINASKSGVTLSSPVWIWFEKEEKKDLAQCLICKKTIQSKTGKSTKMQNHLRLTYGSLLKINAAKVLDELLKSETHVDRKMN